MKLKKLLILISLVFLLGMLLIACGNETASDDDSEQSQESENSGTDESSDVESGELNIDDRSDWPSNLRLGSASVGGVYNIYGSGMASLLEKELDVPTSSEVTGGPADNIQLIENADIELGLTTLGPAYDAWFGEGDWTGGNEFRNYRILFPMYPTVVHWFTYSRTGIETLSDLEGKQVATGPVGGTGATYLPQILDKLGIEPDKIINAGLSDAASQLQDGIVDVIGLAGGFPDPLIQEAEVQHDLNIIGFEDDEIDLILQDFDYFTESSIEAGSYNTLEEDIGALDMYNVAIANKDIPDSLAYHIVDTVMNNNEEMINVHAVSVDTVPENVDVISFGYMHPGAIKWFEDNGYEISEAVYPPDYPY